MYSTCNKQVIGPFAKCINLYVLAVHLVSSYQSVTNLPVDNHIIKFARFYIIYIVKNSFYPVNGITTHALIEYDKK